MLINLLQYLQNSSGEKGKRYFEKNVKSLRSQFTTYNNNKNWFDDECKRKRQLYRKAMGDYNKSQTAVNRVFSSKKDQYQCRKMKNDYDNSRCKQINELKT